MALPSRTFSNFQELFNYILLYWTTNGAGNISGEEGNNIVNGILTFTTKAPLNSAGVVLVNQSTPYTVVNAVTLFYTRVPSSVVFGDNIYNEWVFINTTNVNIPFSQTPTQLGYFDINFTFTNYILAKSILRISKATNGLWVQTGLYGGTIPPLPPTPPPIKGVAGRGQAQDPLVGATTYQNDSIIGLGGANVALDIYRNGGLYQNWGSNPNTFSYDPATGIISALDPWIAGESLEINLNQ